MYNASKLKSEIFNLDNRQETVYAWVREVFGPEYITSRKERVARILEEAMELFQAEGLGKEDALRILNHVMERPPGDLDQELGGLGTTVLAYSATIGKNFSKILDREIDRILSLPKEKFIKRNLEKRVVGINYAAFQTVPDEIVIRREKNE